MNKLDYRTCIRGIKNDFKIAVDDAFCVLENIVDDIEHLKIKSSKPDKLAASLLLDYLGWEEGQSKQNLEKLCGKEISEYMSWLDYHCKKEGISKEQALKEIIEGT